VLTDVRLSELQREATDVIATLDSALEDPRFKLALAALVIAKDRNSWKRYAGRMTSGGLRANQTG